MSFLKVMGIIVVVQVVLTVIGGEVFSCTPITPSHWLVIILMALTIIPVDMIRKVIFNSIKKENVKEQVVEAA